MKTKAVEQIEELMKGITKESEFTEIERRRKGKYYLSRHRVSGLTNRLLGNVPVSGDDKERVPGAEEPIAPLLGDRGYLLQTR